MDEAEFSLYVKYMDMGEPVNDFPRNFEEFRIYLSFIDSKVPWWEKII